MSNLQGARPHGLTASHCMMHIDCTGATDSGMRIQPCEIVKPQHKASTIPSACAAVMSNVWRPGQARHCLTIAIPTHECSRYQRVMSPAGRPKRCVEIQDGLTGKSCIVDPALASAVPYAGCWRWNNSSDRREVPGWRDAAADKASAWDIDSALLDFLWGVSRPLCRRDSELWISCSCCGQHQVWFADHRVDVGIHACARHKLIGLLQPDGLDCLGCSCHTWMDAPFLEHVIQGLTPTRQMKWPSEHHLAHKATFPSGACTANGRTNRYAPLHSSQNEPQGCRWWKERQGCLMPVHGRGPAGRWCWWWGIVHQQAACSGSLPNPRLHLNTLSALSRCGPAHARTILADHTQRRRRHASNSVALHLSLHPDSRMHERASGASNGIPLQLRSSSYCRDFHSGCLGIFSLMLPLMLVNAEDLPFCMTSSTDRHVLVFC